MQENFNANLIETARLLIANNYARSYKEIATAGGKSYSYFTELKSGKIRYSNEFVERLSTIYPINTEFVFSGIGEPILPKGPFNTTSKSSSLTDQTEIQNVPCLPVGIYKRKNLDCVDYIQSNSVPHIKLSNSFGSIDMLYTVRDSSMAPDFHQGDIIGLREIALDTTIVNGNTYVICTNTNGLICRIITDLKNGTLLLSAMDKSRYSDFTISKNDVIRAFAAIYLVRPYL